MKPKAYIETSVLSYLTSRPHADIVVAGHQEVTKVWWTSVANSFELVASELVVQEASAGDSSAAQLRLQALRGVDLLELDETALDLAQRLVDSGAIPANAVEDAIHVAICAAHGIEYLVTWNCRHIANAVMRGQIESVCRSAQLEPPIICTPDELAGTYGGNLD
jgi:predicted nucleic acid-binding protein